MSQQTSDKPRRTYVPLTEQQVEMFRQGLINSEWCGFSKRGTVNTVCDMAINALLYAQEIDRLRSTPLSASEAKLRKVITDAQDILATYIVSDSGISDHECINRLLGLLDGQQSRDALALSAIEAPLSKGELQALLDYHDVSSAEAEAMDYVESAKHHDERSAYYRALLAKYGSPDGGSAS